MDYNYIDTPCAVCEPHIKVDPIFDENPLITPYYRKAIKNTPDWFLHLDYEVYGSEYLLYVITTRLRYEVPLEYDINYKTYKDHELMRYVVDFGDYKENTSYYQQLINDITTKHPNHCMLLHMNQSFISKNQLKPLPSDWVISVLPYCYHHLIDSQYDPILEKNQILININPDRTYNDPAVNTENIYQYYYNFNFVYDKLYELVIKQLQHFYNHGVVVVSKIYNQSIIDKYDMKPVYHEKQDVQLYVPKYYISPELLMKELRN
jgi:hypothetical protein